MLRPIKKKKDRKCICDVPGVLKKITYNPPPLKDTEINQIRLNLFTERNSDGTGNLVLRGKDIFDRYKKRIQDSDIRAIILYIREAQRRITTLDLCYNKITDKGFFKIVKRLLVKGRSSIKHLNMMNNELTELSMKLLAKYAHLLKLETLRINGNKIGTNGGKFVAEMIRNNDTLKHLNIAETDQTLSSVPHIVSALRSDCKGNTTLKVLDLSRIINLFNRYNYETKWLAYQMEFLLERNANLIELHLQKNDFISHDVEYLVRGLRQNKTLLYLDLGYNKIGDYGAELLGQYLKENPSLILLNLAANGIKDTGARALSFGLPFSKVRALDLAMNKIKTDGLLDILNSIKKAWFIRFLNIWGNDLTHPVCLVIQRMLITGALFQHTIDVKLYEVDGELKAAYYPNPADRNKHIYYCEMDFDYAQPILHIKRNHIPEFKTVKVDCQYRHKLDKTNRTDF